MIIGSLPAVPATHLVLAVEEVAALMFMGTALRSWNAGRGTATAPKLCPRYQALCEAQPGLSCQARRGRHQVHTL